MSTLPVRLNSIPLNLSLTARASSSPRKYWIPVLCALVFICFTSTTFMGGSNTGAAVCSVWKVLFGNHNLKLAMEINYVGRKIGHFFGYGMVGLIFRNAWYKTASAFSLVVKTWLNQFAAFLAVVSTFTVGALDEYHQMFLPGRVGCLHDALLDTSGALFLNLLFLTIVTYKRKQTQRVYRSSSYSPA